MVLKGRRGRYEIIKPLARSSEANLYLCSDGEESYLLMIATDVGKNAKFGLSEYILGEMDRVGKLYGEKFAQLHPKRELLNYDWLFPQVHDSFIATEQGGRAVNVLSVAGDVGFSGLTPLPKIIREERRVDLATSVWIIGRLLKLLILAHDQCVAISLTESDILIGPTSHRVIVINWLGAITYQENIPKEIRETNIKSVARIAQKITGIEPELRNSDYYHLLDRLIVEPGNNVKAVYEEFERTHEKLLDRKIFYPFRIL